MVDQERQYAETIHKNNKLWEQTIPNYEANGKVFGSLLQGINGYQKKEAELKIERGNLIKETVNSTISLSHSALNRSIDKFLTVIDKEAKKIIILEKDSDKQFLAFINLIQEAEICMSKNNKFQKDFWIYERNFLKSALDQLAQQQELTREMVNIWQAAIGLETERIENLKKLLRKILGAEKVNSKHLSSILEDISSTDSREAAG